MKIELEGLRKHLKNSKIITFLKAKHNVSVQTNLFQLNTEFYII